MLPEILKQALIQQAQRGGAYCIQGNCIDRADTAGCNGKGWAEGVSYTLDTIDRPAVFDARSNGDGKIAPTMTGDHQNRATDYTAICVGNGQVNQSFGDAVGALNCMHDQQAVAIFQNTCHGWWNESEVGATIRTPCGGDSTKANLVAGVNCRNGNEFPELNGTMQAKPSGGFSLNCNQVVRCAHAVRRLTPLECERLQGYPDGWTELEEWIDSKGKKRQVTDSARYKALGNSIALPFWHWMMKRMARYLPENATLGSLFDGIGGFPLCWEIIHGPATARWASEIEEFPIAVTKARFGND